MEIVKYLFGNSLTIFISFQEDTLNLPLFRPWSLGPGLLGVHCDVWFR